MCMVANTLSLNNNIMSLTVIALCYSGLIFIGETLQTFIHEQFQICLYIHYRSLFARHGQYNLLTHVALSDVTNVIWYSSVSFRDFGIFSVKSFLVFTHAQFCCVIYNKCCLSILETVRSHSEITTPLPAKLNRRLIIFLNYKLVLVTNTLSHL